ncbi:MAG: flagellar hook protein, partial [Sphingomonadales bacterium]
MVTSVGSSILTSLGASSIDTGSLVDQLATAAIADKQKALTNRETANTSRISDLATAVNSVTSFSSALASLVSGGSLYTQPTSSNASIVKVSALAGARLNGLSASIKVEKLATAQTLTAEPLASPATKVGLGTMTLTVGSQTKTITITAANNSLAGLAKAIKDAGLNVTASTITDSTGSRLVIKGATGADNAFSLTMASGNPGEIDRFVYDPNSYDPDNITGLTRQQEAENAEIIVDGVKINLMSALPGSIVTIGSDQPIDAIKQAVSDFVDA